MGVMIAPVAGSGSWPTWIARVSKPSGSLSMPVSLALDPLEPEDAGEACSGLLQLRVDVPGRPRLGREPADAQDAFGAIGLHVRAAEKAVAGEQRQHVVAVQPLVLALVDLDHVLEPEHPLEQRPVP